jgi:hypothetical protein
MQKAASVKERKHAKPEKAAKELVAISRRCQASGSPLIYAAKLQRLALNKQEFASRAIPRETIHAT